MKKQLKGLDIFVDIFIGVLIAALILIMCLSCGTTKPVPSPTIEYRDTVIYRDRVIHDTTTFEVPVEVEKIVTRDTASHLENSWAKSDAMVSEGFLHHSLESIPQVIKVPYTVEVKDTVIIHEESTQEPPQIVEVEKELSWWQRFEIGAFWWLVVIALIGWRREIVALIKNIIKLFV